MNLINKLYIYEKVVNLDSNQKKNEIKNRNSSYNILIQNSLPTKKKIEGEREKERGERER